MPSKTPKSLLVTGGAGFIGSAFIRYVLKNHKEVKALVNLDLLTYAGHLENLSTCEKDPRYHFVHGDILNTPLVEEIVRTHKIDTIVHFAAESHVDRSIENPRAFYRTNVEGTLSLLEVIRLFPEIHFHHVSTDEVYGSTVEGEFLEDSPYRPNSPYAASKAASDHFVRAYWKTYDLSVTLSNCSNNYGPYQFREKFIPRMIYCCMKKEELPIYGDGKNVRDWLFVDDHAEAIWTILVKGKRGENYNIGGSFEACNLDLLKQLIDRYAKACGDAPSKYEALITHVKDRPGHDFRYALNCEKMKTELGWKPKQTFSRGLDKTIKWYLNAWK